MCRRSYLPWAAVLPLLFAGSWSFAQEKAAEEKPKIPEPNRLTIQTADGISLAATFYPGTKGKETVPVVLLHMFKGNGNDYAQLAVDLQKLGHAVLVPDLRGHGESASGQGTRGPLQAASMPPGEFANMVRFDMPALKLFLLTKNNAGDLNIEKLCLVGAEMGASVALSFTYLDWMCAPEGNKKQGQDVKALVLLSPDWSTAGVPLRTVLTARPLTTIAFDPQLQRVFKDPTAVDFRLPVELDFRREVSVYVVVGKGNPKALADATRLHAMLKPFHPNPPKAQEEQQRDLFLATLNTSLQGTKMLQESGLSLGERIARFIHIRLVQRSFPWAERFNPYARPRGPASG